MNEESNTKIIMDKLIRDRNTLIEEKEKLKIQLRVARDSALRTYDGLAQRADMADELAKALSDILEFHFYGIYAEPYKELLNKYKNNLTS